MKRNLIKNLLLIIYTSAVYTSVQAYNMYNEHLKNYNFGLALAAFEFCSLVIIRFAYPQLERRVLTFLKLKVEDDYSSIRQTFALQKRAVIFLGVGNFISFAAMLPFLTSAGNALLFVIFNSISYVIQVPLARKRFNDPVSNPQQYNVGLAIVVIGAAAFELSTQHELKTNITDNLFLLLGLLTKTAFDIYGSIIQRGITSPPFSREKAVSTKSVEEIKTYFTVTGGIILGSILCLSHQYSFALPSREEVSAILFIGVVVSLAGTLGIRLLNEVNHAKSQPIQATRPILGFVPIFYEYLQNGTGGMHILFQALCLITVAGGVLFCLKKAEKGQNSILNLN